MVALRPNIFIGALVWGLAVAAPASAQLLPCVSQATDPCVINSTTNIAVGTYDIRPRSLSVGNKSLTLTGAGTVKILANNITLTPGARFISVQTTGNIAVDLEATGFIDIQSMGTSKSKIDTTSNFGGGNIFLHAGTNVTVNGPLIANANDPAGAAFGGAVDILAATGNIVVSGDSGEGIKSNGKTYGDAQGGGGTISLNAPFGSVTVSTQLAPKGGDCSSCEVDLNAGTDIITTVSGLIDMRASGIGDGGFFSATAGGNVNLAGQVLSNGSAADEACGAGGCKDGGTGGDVLISANGSVTMSNRVELNGAGRFDTAVLGDSVDGDGGSVDISAGTTIAVTGPMFGVSKGFGQSDEFSFDAVGDITLNGEIDMSGDSFSGDITVLSDALITVGARLRTATPIDPVNRPSSLGGTIDIEGCKFNLLSAGSLVSTGPGGSPSGATFLAASTQMTIAGPVTSTAENEFSWRTTAPSITGAVSPAPTLIQNMTLPCCGVSCPLPTTTTTSTTSPTTTLATTTTHASTTTVPTTSSSSTSSSTSTSTSSSTSSSSSSTSTSSTTSSSTSTTTLVFGCPATPALTCRTGAKVQFQVVEKVAGKEQIKAKIDKLALDTPLALFGNPLSGTTDYAVCLYDGTGARIATVSIPHTQQTCGTKPCWKTSGSTVVKYTDKTLSSDGALQLQLKGGEPTKGKIQFKAKNNGPKGQLEMPTGLTLQLTNDVAATVQVRISNGTCFSGTVTDIRENSATQFKGQEP